MRMTLKGRVAIVTGGSRGIGREIALGLADDGATVVIAFRSQVEKANQTLSAIQSKAGRCLAVQTDVSKRDSINRLVQKTNETFGRIDILVNCAGVPLNRDFLKITEEEWDYVNAVNTKSIFFATQSVVPLMQKVGGGRIVNIVSISGLKPTGIEKVVYCASKASAVMLTKALACALAQYNITVNAIAPGTVETDITAERMKDPDWLAGRVNSIPMGRIGMPIDFVEAVRYFASPNSAWTTGSVLVVDGGQVLS